MNYKRLGAVLVSTLLLVCTAQAQQFEMVISLDGVSSATARSAMAELAADPGMRDARVTLYAADLGVRDGSLKVVADYDSYQERVERDRRRLASHGWTTFQLAMQGVDLVATDMVGVVADYGAPRHTAGYLVVYILHVQDPAAYAAALQELNEAADNPGVLRLVAFRSGSRAATHAVLIGGDDFASVNEYMDDLFASDAFSTFADKVSDIREVLHIEAYRRLGAWGY